MCIPEVVGATISTVTGITSKAIQINQQSKEFKYRQQLAINNAKNANNEALRQKQLGIDESRKEKILGLKEASRQKAINSAGNFNLNSETLNFGQNDILNQYNNQAKAIENSYNLKSDYYFNQANSYLNQANQTNKSYKNYVFNTSINSLNELSQVSQEWYKGRIDL